MESDLSCNVLREEQHSRDPVIVVHNKINTLRKNKSLLHYIHLLVASGLFYFILMNMAELTQILLFAYNNKLLPKW